MRHFWVIFNHCDKFPFNEKTCRRADIISLIHFFDRLIIFSRLLNKAFHAYLIFLIFSRCSVTIRLHYHFCGRFSSCPLFCTAQQLGRNPPGCSKIRLWNPKSCGWTSRKYRHLVQNLGYVGSICCHHQRKNITNTFLESLPWEFTLGSKSIFWSKKHFDENLLNHLF